MKKYRCVICGYIHEGNEPPEKCPLCQMPSDKFELIEDDGAAESPAEAAEITEPSQIGEVQCSFSREEL